MVRFPVQAVLAPLPAEERGRGRFALLQDLPVDFGDEALAGAWPGVVIPAGFVTDGASIPWWARPLWGSWGRVGLPALLHDWLLAETALAKRDCDWLFLGALHAQGVPDLQAVLMYLGVRARPGRA